MSTPSHRRQDAPKRDARTGQPVVPGGTAATPAEPAPGTGTPPATPVTTAISVAPNFADHEEADQ